ncbi:MAG TPA: type II toxin-antitoxin system VapC family toxin [Solirubrobacteraceae bacterium]|jgi:predicted nucleic acid-binding protein|nr:type II toxin-antitoxin system VapC family toxin [Solirubrobacteraceae bacterium]
MTVVDASAVIDLLAPPDPARRDFMIAELPEPGEPWLAPDILPFEVFSVVRRHHLRSVLTVKLAGAALRRLRMLPIELVPTSSLLDAAWTLRDRFSAGDSLYAALAMRAGEPLLTSDMRLARAASDKGIDVRRP